MSKKRTANARGLRREASARGVIGRGRTPLSDMTERSRVHKLIGKPAKARLLHTAVTGTVVAVDSNKSATFKLDSGGLVHVPLKQIAEVVT